MISPQPQDGQPPRRSTDPGGPAVSLARTVAPGQLLQPAPQGNGDRYVPPEAQDQGTFSRDEIMETGHRFFGSVSMGFARAIEYTFQRAGRPNGYILGEEAGGAFIAGLRYGEGTLYTHDAGDQSLLAGPLARLRFRRRGL